MQCSMNEEDLGASQAPFLGLQVGVTGKEQPLRRSQDEQLLVRTAS